MAYALDKLVRGTSLSRFQTDKTSAQLSATQAQRTVIVVPHSRMAEELYFDLGFFLREEKNPEHPPLLLNRLPGWEVLPFDVLSPSTEITAERMISLSTLLTAQRQVVIVSAEVMTQRIASPKSLQEYSLRLEQGEMVERDQLIAALDEMGYLRSSLVEERGQLAVRGAIVDLMTAGLDHPVRLELFGDELASIRLFDVGTQRSLQSISSVKILPARELFPSWFSPQTSMTGNIERKDPRESAEWLRAQRLLRDRALALEIPTRVFEGAEESLLTGAPWPGIEHLAPIFAESTATLFDYFETEGPLQLVLVEPEAIRDELEIYGELIQERAKRNQEEGTLFPLPELAYCDPASVWDRLESSASVSFEQTELFSFDAEVDLKAELSEADDIVQSQRSQATLGFYEPAKLEMSLRRGKFQELPLRPFAEELRKLLAENFEVLVAVTSSQRGKRFEELFENYALPYAPFGGTFSQWHRALTARDSTTRKPPLVTIVEGALSSALISPFEGFVIIPEQLVFPGVPARRKTKSPEVSRRLLGSLSQMKENDFVVHIDHGVAIYRGLKQLTVEGQTGDFLQLEFAGQSKLFLPIENLTKIQKYIGAEGKQPALSKLGTKNWSEKKQKVKEQLVELAAQLLNLYAEREFVPGISYPPNGPDDREFADTFAFQETADQAKAIEEVLGDMTKETPMDRLVCGDVGYGKTEVALRAAFKAMNNGKQVAFLVPTTVLADQHYATCRERFSQFPFKIGCVSRFFSKQENQQTLEKLATGELNLIVGTHRILQKDVKFADLGLLIIDEEHRFGVADKERLKKLRKEVDVLTLTATPIPRTLHMSLLNIRDLSVIETPPVDRQVIRTYLAPYQEGVVREAILRELGRSGQVFYIYNRVATIAQVAEDLRRLVPEAKIDFGHGQMRDDELEKVMHRFIQREIDVLVSTTIVESGLDIPNANTIIIRDADKLGLAELYQLRGRVGRSSRRAYAYLLVGENRNMTPEAKKRLKVLQSLDDLGMGFKLALQDMEIRGAGNLLGKDQTGKIELVGFELYTKILRDAVRELRARRAGLPPEPAAMQIDPEVFIGVQAFIPTAYIPDIEEKLLLYQRLVELRDREEAIAISEEIQDRFGNMPHEVSNLLEVMALRSVLRTAGVLKLTLKGDLLTLSFHREAPLDTEKLLQLIQQSKGKNRFSPAYVLTMRRAEQFNGDVSEFSIQIERLLKSITG